MLVDALRGNRNVDVRGRILKGSGRTNTRRKL
jgi:hypothetical protein